MSIRSKIIIFNVIILVILSGLTTISYVVLKNAYVANNWVLHTHNVIEKSLKIEKHAIDMETGMRGFLLAGTEEFLEPYASGYEGFKHLIKDLKVTVSDNPPQVKRLVEIDEHMRQWQEVIVKPAIRLRYAVGTEISMNDISELVGEAGGKMYFDIFRDKIKKFRDIEVGLMQKRQSESNKTFTF